MPTTMFAPSRLASLLRIVALLTGLMVPALAGGQTFVQVNSNATAVNAASVNVTYTAAETAGHLNMVVVGWTDVTSSVVSVVDDNTNIYRLAGTTAGPRFAEGIYSPHTTVCP